MVQHVFAEIALASVGPRVEPGTPDVAILAAGDIFGRADLDVVGAAVGVIVGSGVDHGGLSPLQATCEQRRDQQERDETCRVHDNTFCLTMRNLPSGTAHGTGSMAAPALALTA